MHRSRTSRRSLDRSVRSFVEGLELRRLLAVTPRDVVAFADDGTQQGNTPRSVVFYDAQDIKTAGGTPTKFTTPLFSIWTGYELTEYFGIQRNYEDFVSIDFDDKGEFGYMLAFDSGTFGQPDDGGDTQGDYDLYKLNVKAAYEDFVNNERAPGVMYAPRYSPDYNATTGTGIDYIATYAGTPQNPTLGPTGLPAADSNDTGIPQLEGTFATTIIRSNEDTDKANDIVFLDGVSIKIGEVGRYGAPTNPNVGFTNEQEIQYVNDSTLVLIEKPLVPYVGFGTREQDWSIRTIERVNTAPGFATPKVRETGGTNGNTKESWESFEWLGDNYVGLDGDQAENRPISDVDGMRYVVRDGVQGVWVSDRVHTAPANQPQDTSGDVVANFAFFAMDFATRTATRMEDRVATRPAGGYPETWGLDENPTASTTTDDGDLDGFDLDANGNLIIRESGFPGTETRVFVQNVADYTAGDSDASGVAEYLLGTTDVKAALTHANPADDDDTGPLDTRTATFDPIKNLLYIFDADSGTGALPDVYVYDLTTGQIVYSQLNVANHLFRDGNRIRTLTIGAGADTVAPTVALAYSNATEQAVTLTFSEPLATSGAGALTAADLVLRNTTTNTTIPTGDVTVTSLGGNVYKVTYKTGAASAPLAKGIYTLTVTGSGVTDAAGNPVAGTPSVQFRVLPGDANGDGNVNFDDLLILAQNYGSSGKNYAAGNFTYDAAGSVNFDDLLLLAQNYGTSLAVAAPKPVVAAKRTSSRSVASEVL